MIPKVIHYCWFGGKPLDKLGQKCLNSWKKHCPDYEIKEWNESNFDINCCKYVKEAYEARKFAFVSDYVRLYVMCNYGGIYMDTDVEVIKCIDGFLSEKAFSGFESEKRIPTGIMACEKGFRLFKELLSYYDNVKFINEDGTYNVITNVQIITKLLTYKGFVPNGKYQKIEGFALYPPEYFCPIDMETGNLIITKNTYAIHRFAGSWEKKSNKFRGKIYRFINRHFGRKVAKMMKKIFGRKQV